MDKKTRYPKPLVYIAQVFLSLLILGLVASWGVKVAQANLFISPETVQKAMWK